MQRTRLAVAIALALVGCVDDPDIIMDTHPPDVIVNYDCPCLEGLCEHVVNITEEVYPTETVYVTEEDTTPDVVQEFYGDASSLPVLLLVGTGDPMPKKLTDPAIAVATELNDADRLYLEQGGVSKSIAASVFWVPTNYIGGLITSNNVAEPDDDIDIAPGIARSDDDAASLKLAAILTKQIDATWAVGDDAGGMEAADHPVQASTLYALWLIKRSDTGVVDAMFSLDFSSPTLPTDYDYKRLIGAVVTDAGSDIVPYIQTGDEFTYLDEYPLDVNDNSMASTVFETGVLSVPPNCKAHVYGLVSNPTSTDAVGNALYIRPTGAAGFVATQSLAWMVVAVAANSDAAARGGDIIVDGSSQVDYAVVETSGTATVTIRTAGFTMLTRSNP